MSPIAEVDVSILTGNSGSMPFSSAVSTMHIRCLIMGVACLAAVLIHLMSGRHMSGSRSLKSDTEQNGPIVFVQKKKRSRDYGTCLRAKEWGNKAGVQC